MEIKGNFEWIDDDVARLSWFGEDSGTCDELRLPRPEEWPLLSILKGARTDSPFPSPIR